MVSDKSAKGGLDGRCTTSVLKGGLVLDKANGLEDNKDVAVTGGKIAAVENKISEGSAKKTIDVRGHIVSPGLVDIHTHVAYEITRLSIDPYARCLLRGTTTTLDAGSTGELNFPGFKTYVIDRSKERIKVLVNIESLGMIEFADVKPGNTDQEWPSLLTRSKEKLAGMFISESNTEAVIRRSRDTVVGIKWAHHGIKGMEKARNTADAAECKLMIENMFMPEASRYVKKGDIVTHIFHDAFQPELGLRRRHLPGREDTRGVLPDGQEKRDPRCRPRAGEFLVGGGRVRLQGRASADDDKFGPVVREHRRSGL